MSNAEHELLDYLKRAAILSQHELKNHKQLSRRVMTLVVSIGMAFLTMAGTCLWGIYGLYKHKSEVIEQALIIRAAATAMSLVCPHENHTLIEVTLPDGGVVIREVSQ